jgi:hypothetical protein
MNLRDKERRRAVRRIFVDTDLADLGFGGVEFPEYEYDTEADLAMSWLANGLSPTEVAARAARYIQRDWGVPVSDRKVEQLTHALTLLRSKPEWQN